MLKSLPRIRSNLTLLSGWALAIGIILCLIGWSGASIAFAQTTQPQIVEAIEPPLGAQAQSYKKAAQAQGLRTSVIYSTDFAAGARDMSPVGTQDYRKLRFGGGGGIIGIGLAIVLMLAAFGIWLRFGGSGVVFSRAPREIELQSTAPKSWGIEANETLTGTDGLIEQLRGTEDRSKALVKLLRHALLAAGQVNNTRFARADTEREAFARLPRNWLHREDLANILKSAELAHYGGHPVSDSAFEKALSAGQTILNAARHHA